MASLSVVAELMRKRMQEAFEERTKDLAPVKPTPIPERKVVIQPPKEKPIIIPPPTPPKQGVLSPPEGKATVILPDERVIKVDYDEPQETDGDPGIAESIANAVDDLAEHAEARTVYYEQQKTVLTGLAVVSTLFVAYWVYTRFY